MMLDIIAGARPNFMKIAPLIHAIEEYNLKTAPKKIDFRLIHTGQHYDRLLSQSFFEQLDIPNPDVNLAVGSGTHGSQTARIMEKYEEVLLLAQPDLTVVVGDVNSTMACAIVAKKCNVAVAHIEAGIRSGDRSMPEEINRIVTDAISDVLFTTSRLAGEQLLSEGKRPDQIHFVGNTMIDSLMANLPRLKRPADEVLAGVLEKPYLVLTLHRPSNVDTTSALSKILQHLNQEVEELPIIFPMHPRTSKIFDQLHTRFENLLVIPPLAYLEFIYLVKNSIGVITDSGGITEEATVLKVPCITMRNSTERPETIIQGSNVLVGSDLQALSDHLQMIKKGAWKESSIPELWDGQAAKRIVKVLADL